MEEWPPAAGVQGQAVSSLTYLAKQISYIDHLIAKDGCPTFELQGGIRHIGKGTGEESRKDSGDREKTGKDNRRRGNTESKKQGGDENGKGRRKAPASRRCISVMKSTDPGLLRNLPRDRALPGLATRVQAYIGSACAAHGTAAANVFRNAKRTALQPRRFPKPQNARNCNH